MVRKDLEDAIYQRGGMTRAASREIVDTVFNTITHGLSKGEEVKIHEFGAFHVRTRPARKVTNPRTKETMEVGPRSTVAFKPSTPLKRLVG